MIKDLAFQFMKDRNLYIVFYCLNMACIILFYHFIHPSNNEYYYPIIIGLFLLIIFLIVDWLRYYSFNKQIRLLQDEQYVELEPITEEQKAVKKLFDKRNREYSNTKIQLREKHKERINFLSHWMHNLKTPVSVIELIIDKEELDYPNSSKTLQQIKRENKGLHTSIEQGLTMIRMDGFENDFEVRSIDIISSLRKIINDKKSEFIYSGVIPDIIFEQEPLYVLTDKKWNEILLDQILSNAIKYSSNKKGNKKIVFEVISDENCITLSIRDEGIGIPPYDIERVFEPFFTGENGREYRNSSGIGLYLCKKIADKLGQTITIQSEVSSGTEVQIRYLTKV